MSDVVDVIIVPGAALKDDGTPSAPMRRRVLAACKLYEDGRAKRLLMSGGATRHPTPEAHMMRDLAIARGIPAEAIAVETASLISWHNVVHSLAMMKREGWRTAIVVSDGFHLPRLRALFRLQGMRPDFVAAPLGSGDSRLSLAGAILREAFAIMKFFAMALHHLIRKCFK